MNAKLTPLTADDVARYVPPGQVLRHLERLDRSRDPLLLDYGCGRGALVWWLRLRGWNAHGYEPNAAYVANGAPAALALDLDPGCLHHDSADLPDSSVDAIYSVQVLEHVQDLQSSALEMRRLLRAGGTGRHIFPARRTPIEPHVKLPLVHWTGRASRQRRIVGLLLALGWDGWAMDREQPRAQRRDKIVAYLQRETAYRSTSEVLSIFDRAGLEATVDMRDSRLFPLVGWVPGGLGARGLATLTNVTIDMRG